MICFRKKANAKGWGADAVSVLMEFQKMDKRREDMFVQIYFSSLDKKIYVGENTYRMMMEDSACWAFYGSHLVEHRWKICAGSEICSGHVANVFGHFICKSAHLTPRDGLIRCVISP